MNSPFLRSQAVGLADRVAREPDVPAKVRALYRIVLARDPDTRELDLATQYISAATVQDFAHALLGTNEVIYWP
jgi:hypothetical protein